MASLSLTKLVNRKLIRISGPDCYPYLQSLFCNDIRYLYEPNKVPTRIHANVSSSVMSTFMLNAQGRAICDLLLYRTPNTRYECHFTPPGEAKENDELYIECDSSQASGLANTLYGYRVRRKITLEIMNDKQIWCLYPNLAGRQKQLSSCDASQLQVYKLPSVKEVLNNDLTIVSDPRLDLMGLRIIADTSQDFSMLTKILQTHVDLQHTIQEKRITSYVVHRYTLGIGEGPEDHPESRCFPLESNADLLGSVSFDKGCYLGQELTARIHFTGVIRKRLMPSIVHVDKSKPPSMPLIAGSDVVEEENGKKVGSLRHVVNGHALCLLRTDLFNETTQLMHEGSKTKITAWRPYWWNQ